MTELLFGTSTFQPRLAGSSPVPGPAAWPWLPTQEASSFWPELVVTWIV